MLVLYCHGRNSKNKEREREREDEWYLSITKYFSTFGCILVRVHLKNVRDDGVDLDVPDQPGEEDLLDDVALEGAQRRQPSNNSPASQSEDSYYKQVLRRSMEVTDRRDGQTGSWGSFTSNKIKN